MKRWSFARLLVIFSVYVSYCSIACADENTGPFVSFGYGRLSVSNVVVDQGPNFSYIEERIEKFDESTWNFYDIGLGYAFNSGKTHVFLNYLFSESKVLEVDEGTRPLLGGGVTHVSSEINHGGVFLGMSQELYSGLFAAVAIGSLYQGKEFHYSPDVANDGSGDSVMFAAWSAGLDLKLDNIVFGAKYINSFGGPLFDYSEIGEAPEINGAIFHVSFIFN